MNDAISRMPFLAGLTPAERARVLAEAEARRFRPSEALFAQGDPPSHLHALASGAVKMWRDTPSGARMIVRFMNPGDLLGCVAVFRQIPFPANATAETECRTLAWPSDRIGALLKEYPVLSANALTIVGERTAEMLQRVQELSTEPVERRIAGALLRLLDKAGPSAGAAAPIILRVSRRDLAELTGSTLHTVSRTISAWEDRGFVRGGRGRVAILDPERLKTIVRLRT